MASRRSSNWSSFVRCGAESYASGRTVKMKTMTAPSSSAQATREVMSMLFIGFPAGFIPGTREKFGGNVGTTRGCNSGASSPAPDDFPKEIERNEREHDRHDPRNAVETLRGGLGKYRRA